MTYFAPADSVTYLAAQLAMLALRAGVSNELALAADRVILAPSSASISVEEATNRLANLPKPLFCLAYPLDGVLRIECTTWNDAKPHEQRWYRLTREEDAKRRSYLWYLDEQYGPSSAHPVLAFGRGDETLLLPSSAVDAWYRDYEIGGTNSVADGVGNAHLAADPAYREARRRGAHGLLRFSSPVDSEGSISVTIGPPEHIVDHNPTPSEDYLIESAHHYYQDLLLERLGRVSGRGDPSPETSQREQTRNEDRKHIRQLVKQMRAYYQTRPSPRLVSAFLEECTRLPWCRPQN